MGFTAALLSKTGSDVSAQLRRMLRMASPAAGEGYGIATPEGAVYLTAPESPSEYGSNVMLGHKLFVIRPNDPPQPINQHGYSLTFDGRLWNLQGASDFAGAADVLGQDPEEGVGRLIEDGGGSFAVAVADGDRILCGRDPVGVVPLYIGESTSLVGVASNRKMLHSVGIGARPLPPGCAAEITRGGVRIRPVRILSNTPTRDVAIEDALDELDALLLGAVEARSKGVHSASLGFSGGIDSSLLAYYLDRCGVEVDLICVGLAGSAFEEAEEAAESLGLPIRLESYTLKDVEECLTEVLDSVEEPDPMKIGVALPIFWAAESAVKHGNRIFYSGCGSDEIFGGYHKYIQEYAEFGGRVKEMMFRDVVTSHEVNFERDYKVCADMGVELRLPFADLKLIEFGLALPIEYKFSKDGSVRKLLLRELAKMKGLSEAIVSRRKRAVQYSTGVSRALRKLAKREGTTLKRYLAEVFNGIEGGWREG